MLAVLSLKGATRRPLLKETSDAGQTVWLQPLTCYTKLLCEIFLPFVNLSLLRQGFNYADLAGLELRVVH